MVAKRVCISLAVSLAALSLVLVCEGSTQPSPDAQTSATSGQWGGESAYADYAAALKYVDDKALVDYKRLKADRGRLDAFVRSMGALDRKVYEGWGEAEKIAFWLNAYNALTLKAIIDNYPIKPTFPARLRHPNNSIRQIKGVWDKLKFRVMGRQMTLDDIEHETLRKDFNEPRIHLALVCAAMGCPPLRNEPFTGEKLNEQFGDQASRFLGNAKKFRVDRRKKRVYLSPIFKWFGDDFVKTYAQRGKVRGHSKSERAVLNYVSGHVSEADAGYLATADYSVRYLDYDWSLNEQPAAKKP